MKSALALLVVLGSALPAAAQPPDSIFPPRPGNAGVGGLSFGHSPGARSLSPPTPKLTTGPLTDSLRRGPLDRKRDQLGMDGEINPPMPSEPYVLPSQKRIEER